MPDEKQTKNIRILFDNGAQLNYVSPKVCRDLKLFPTDKKEISIKTFGKHVPWKTMYIVQVAIKAKNSDMEIYINAFVSDMCYPLEEQNIDLAQEQFRFSGLESRRIANEHRYTNKLSKLLGFH